MTGHRFVTIESAAAHLYAAAVKKRPAYLSLRERSAYRSLEDVVGCKWSAGVVAALAAGVQRPGELERYIPGISKKILLERLRKLLAYGLITRTAHPGPVQRVDYALTPIGRDLATVITRLRELGATHAGEPGRRVGGGAKRGTKG